MRDTTTQQIEAECASDEETEKKRKERELLQMPLKKPTPDGKPKPVQILIKALFGKRIDMVLAEIFKKEGAWYTLIRPEVSNLLLIMHSN